MGKNKKGKKSSNSTASEAAPKAAVASPVAVEMDVNPADGISESSTVEAPQNDTTREIETPLFFPREESVIKAETTVQQQQQQQQQQQELEQERPVILPRLSSTPDRHKDKRESVAEITEASSLNSSYEIVHEDPVSGATPSKSASSGADMNDDDDWDW